MEEVTIVTTVLDWLSNAWSVVAPYLIAFGTSLVSSGILVKIFAGVTKAVAERHAKETDTAITNANINVEESLAKMSEVAADKTFERIKQVSFSQSLQPVVNSELQKVTEVANNYIKSYLEKCDTRFAELINIIEGLASYFDNSIGVSEEAKASLHKAIEDAKAPETSTEINIINDMITKAVADALNEAKMTAGDEPIDESTVVSEAVKTAFTGDLKLEDSETKVTLER